MYPGMNDVGPITRPQATSPERAARQLQQVSDAPVTPRSTDRAEFSKAAQLLSKLSELPEVRQNLIDRVKSEIAAGTYKTPEKIDEAIESLIADLG